MNNFLTRLLIVVIVGFLVITAASNAVFPSLVTTHQDQVTTKLAAELAAKIAQNAPAAAPEDAPPTPPTQPSSSSKKKRKNKNSQQANSDSSKAGTDKSADKPKPTPTLSKDNLQSVIGTMAQHHLSWFYLTDTHGKVVPLTKNFAPDLPSIDEKSRHLDWHGQSFYESVAPVNQSYDLHAGFVSSPPVGLSGEPVEAQMPLLVALALLAFIVFCIALVYVISVMVPLKKILAHFHRQDSGTGMTAGTLSIPGAILDVQEIRKLIEGKGKVIAERDEMIKDRDNTVRKLNAKLEQELNNAKKEKTVLYLKEAENQFVDHLSSSLDALTTVTAISDGLLTQLHGEFPNSFEFALFFSMNKKQEANLVSHIGFQSNPLEVYKGLGMMKGISDPDSDLCVVLDPADVPESQFKEIAQLTGARYVIMSPLRFQGRRLALIVVFFRGQDQALEHITRVLNRAAHVSAKSLHHITVYEEQVEAARTDELTGYPNKAYLPHLLPQLMASVEGADGERRPFSIFLVEGHDVLAINEKFGRVAGDSVIQELGRRIERLLQQRRTETMGSWGDHLIRYQGAQFLVILRQVDSKKATIFAQRLRQVVEGEDYPCGVGRWNISIGITSFPEDSSNPEELILNVDTALSYARGQSERNKIAHINAVPKAFRSAKLASNLGGSLDVFDPAALLQSLSISRKSGILTVTHPEGKMFWCFLENGKPIKARMGKFTGQAAIIEFLVLFESGEFAFSDLTSIDKQTLDDIGKLPKSFDFPGALERVLMDGALARDHYTSAKNLVKETSLFVWPQPSAKNGEGFAKLKALKDPPTPEEEKIMKEIIAVANGKVQLKIILERLDNQPTATLWRAAGFLVQSDMVQLKKLATSIAL